VIANHLTVGRDGGLQRRDRAERGRLRAGEACLGLRDVGSGDFADGKSVPGLAQLLLQDLDIVAIEVQDRGVFQDVHVGRDACEQGVLLGVAQLFARAHHLGFGAADPVDRLKAVEDILTGLDPVASRKGPGRVPELRRSREYFVSICVLHSGVADGRDLWQIACIGFGHAFVGLADCRALRVDVGVGQIGLDESAANRFRPARSGADRRQTRRREQSRAQGAPRPCAAGCAKPLLKCA